MSDAPPPTSHRRPLWWALVALLALVVVAAVAALLQGGDEAEPRASASPTVSTEPSGSAEPTPTEEPSASETPEPGPSATASEAPGQGVTEGPDGRPTATPVPLPSPAAPAEDVTARLSKLEAVVGETTIPGEVGGPAVRVTVEVVNGTDEALDLSGVVVNAYYGPDQVPAGPIGQPGGDPFTGTLAPGATATGVYLFSIPEDQRDQVRFEVDLTPESTVVIFEGAAPA